MLLCPGHPYRQYATLPEQYNVSTTAGRRAISSGEYGEELAVAVSASKRDVKEAKRLQVSARRRIRF